MAGWGSDPGSIPTPDEEPTSHTEIKENISLELEHFLQFFHGTGDNASMRLQHFQTPQVKEDG